MIELEEIRAQLQESQAEVAGRECECQKCRAERSEAEVERLRARLSKVMEARYAILSAYHDGPPEAMALAIQQLTDALDAALRGEGEK